MCVCVCVCVEREREREERERERERERAREENRASMRHRCRRFLLTPTTNIYPASAYECISSVLILLYI